MNARFLNATAPSDSSAQNQYFVWIILFSFYLICEFTCYGTEVDIYLMIRSWQTFLNEFVYQPSRLPGYFLPEVLLGLLASLGDYHLTNTVAALAGVSILVIFFNLLRKVTTSEQAWMATLLVALNPIYIVASSSSALDNILCPFFYFCGIWMLLKHRHITAGVLFGLAIGSRLNSALIVLSIYLFAMGIHWRQNNHHLLVRTFLSGCLGVVVTGILYSPVMISTSGNFLSYTTGDWDAIGYISRYIYKNIYLFGVAFFTGFFVIFVMGGASRLYKENSDMLGAFLLLLALIIQGQYAMLPHDLRYLLPFLFVSGVALARSQKPAVMITLIVLTASYNVINIQLLDITEDNMGAQAIAAEFRVSLGRGYLWEDLNQRQTVFERHQDKIQHPRWN